MVEVHAELDDEVQQLRIANAGRLKDQDAYEEKLQHLREGIQRLNDTLAGSNKELRAQEQHNRMLSEQVELLQQKLRESKKAETSQRLAHRDLLKAFGGLQQAYSRLAQTATEKTAGISRASNVLAQRRLANIRTPATSTQHDCDNKNTVCPVFQEHHLYSDGATYTPPITEFTKIVKKSKAELEKECSLPKEKRPSASKPNAKPLQSGKRIVVLNKTPEPGAGYVGYGLGLKKNPGEQRVGTLLAGNPAAILRRLEKLKTKPDS